MAIRPNFGIKQRFICINIANARHNCLVQNKRFDDSGAAGDSLAKHIGREIIFKRFGAKFGQNFERVFDQINPAEFAHVPKTQIIPIFQMKQITNVFMHRLTGRDNG